MHTVTGMEPATCRPCRRYAPKPMYHHCHDMLPANSVLLPRLKLLLPSSSCHHGFSLVTQHAHSKVCSAGASPATPQDRPTTKSGSKYGIKVLAALSRSAATPASQLRDPSTGLKGTQLLSSRLPDTVQPQQLKAIPIPHLPASIARGHELRCEFCTAVVLRTRRAPTWHAARDHC